MSLAAVDDAKRKLQAAERSIASPRSEAQKESGNYAKGHLTWNGLDITLENAKGSIRAKGGKNGWKVKMPAAYGYIKGSKGADGDHVDCYVGEALGSDKVWVVDQVDASSGKFDEHKCMLGFSSKADAVRTYHAGFSDGKGPQRCGCVTEMTLDAFKAWLDKGVRKAPVGRLGPRRYASGGFVLPDPYVSQIKRFEGYAPRAQWDYKQYSGGYGTRAEPGEVFTLEKAEQRLAEELAVAHRHVKGLGRELPPGWEPALTSLTYNAGPKWLESGLGEAVRAGDWPRAQALFAQYNKAGGEFNKGLAARRAQELAWVTGNAPAATPQGSTPQDMAVAPAVSSSAPRTEPAQTPANTNHAVAEMLLKAGRSMAGERQPPPSFLPPVTLGAPTNALALAEEAMPYRNREVAMATLGGRPGYADGGEIKSYDPSLGDKIRWAVDDFGRDYLGIHNYGSELAQSGGEVMDALSNASLIAPGAYATTGTLAGASKAASDSSMARALHTFAPKQDVAPAMTRLGTPDGRAKLAREFERSKLFDGSSNDAASYIASMRPGGQKVMHPQSGYWSLIDEPAKAANTNRGGAEALKYDRALYNQTPTRPLELVPKAAGGVVDGAGRDEGYFFGPIKHMGGGGRTDDRPLTVKSGSFVFPADIVSALGEGSSDAGHRIIDRMFPVQGPYGVKPLPLRGRASAGAKTSRKTVKRNFADGGAVDIIAAVDEHILSPEQVASVPGANGDIEKGHMILDRLVKKIRQQHIETLKRLPPPAR